MPATSKAVFCSAALVTAAFATAIAADLSTDDLKLLQDPGGWQYVSVSDQDAGVQTQHVCFDGQPHPNQCSGTLMLNADGNFAEQINIHGQHYDRHGHYEINGDQISFFDEFGNRDGPYTLQLNQNTNMLVLSMPQVRMQLELQKQYKEDLQKKKAPAT